MAKGTPSYRGPEGLREQRRTFANSADVWAMGCILFELVFRQKAFRGDWAVREYAVAKTPEFDAFNLDASIDYEGQLFIDQRFQLGLEAIIKAILKGEPSDRPRVRNLYHLFSIAKSKSWNKQLPSGEQLTGILEVPISSYGTPTSSEGDSSISPPQQKRISRKPVPASILPVPPESSSIRRAHGRTLKHSHNVVNLRQGTIYQATAISETCATVALIDGSRFEIFRVPKKGEKTFEFLYQGEYNRLSMAENKKRSSLHTVLPPQAAISDDVLCIAHNNRLDFYNINTRLPSAHLSLSECCRILTMSPKSKLIAGGLEMGGLRLYALGTVDKFHPILVTELGRGRLFVNCIAFSPNSAYISVGTSDNIIETYSLDPNSSVPTFISRYDRHLSSFACSKPYFGVTGLA